MFEDKIDEETRQIASELKNVVLFILIIIDLVFIFFSTIYSSSFKLENLFADYDFLVCLLLFIDLSYDYYHYEGTLKEFLIKDKNILSLISIFPYDIIFRYFSIFRLFRFVRIFKLVRVYYIKRDLKSFIYFVQHHLFRLLLLILIVYTVVSSILLVIIDTGVDTIEEALWFMIVTTSTVGYGDIVPESPIGRGLTVLTIVIGIIFVAIFTAYLTSVYNQKPEMDTRATFIKNIRKIDKGNKLMKNDITELHSKIDELESENKKLHEKVDTMTEKLDQIMTKMDEK